MALLQTLGERTERLVKIKTKYRNLFLNHLRKQNRKTLEWTAYLKDINHVSHRPVNTLKFRERVTILVGMQRFSGKADTFVGLEGIKIEL